MSDDLPLPEGPYKTINQGSDQQMQHTKSMRTSGTDREGIGAVETARVKARAILGQRADAIFLEEVAAHLDPRPLREVLPPVTGRTRRDRRRPLAMSLTI